LSLKAIRLRCFWIRLVLHLIFWYKGYCQFGGNPKKTVNSLSLKIVMAIRGYQLPRTDIFFGCYYYHNQILFWDGIIISFRSIFLNSNKVWSSVNMLLCYDLSDLDNKEPQFWGAESTIHEAWADIPGEAPSEILKHHILLCNL